MTDLNTSLKQGWFNDKKRHFLNPTKNPDLPKNAVISDNFETFLVSALELLVIKQVSYGYFTTKKTPGDRAMENPPETDMLLKQLGIKMKGLWSISMNHGFLASVEDKSFAVQEQS